MDKFQELDELIDKLIEECYSTISESDSTDVKQVLRIACNKLCRKPKTTQGVGIVDKNQVLFEVEEGVAFPISPMESDDGNV